MILLDVSALCIHQGFMLIMHNIKDFECMGIRCRTL